MKWSESCSCQSRPFRSARPAVAPYEMLTSLMALHTARFVIKVIALYIKNSVPPCPIIFKRNLRA